MLSEANALVSDNQNANFCYADVNCILKKNGMIIRKISLAHLKI